MYLYRWCKIFLYIIVDCNKLLFCFHVQCTCVLIIFTFCTYLWEVGTNWPHAERNHVHGPPSHTTREQLLYSVYELIRGFTGNNDDIKCKNETSLNETTTTFNVTATALNTTTTTFNATNNYDDFPATLIFSSRSLGEIQCPSCPLLCSVTGMESISASEHRNVLSSEINSSSEKGWHLSSKWSFFIEDRSTLDYGKMYNSTSFLYTLTPSRNRMSVRMTNIVQ